MRVNIDCMSRYGAQTRPIWIQGPINCIQMISASGPAMFRYFFGKEGTTDLDNWSNSSSLLIFPALSCWTSDTTLELFLLASSMSAAPLISKLFQDWKWYSPVVPEYSSANGPDFKENMERYPCIAHAWYGSSPKQSSVTIKSPNLVKKVCRRTSIFTFKTYFGLWIASSLLERQLERPSGTTFHRRGISA
jgi:hypothetical protein